MDFVKETISVNAKSNFISKSWEFRTIPLNLILKKHLISIKPKDCKGSEYIFNKPLFKDLFFTIRKAFKTAKIKNAIFHTLRHTFASRLVIKGVS
ncbi:MAG: hypothetical protein LBV16_01340, partial [Elusimicrobiota bacterium]|nr:hypothetical protein [Elusimicrobiota bacterium]